MKEPGDQVLATISAWAESRRDIVALVQIGSRVQPNGTADHWSDYDFQLITHDPELYLDPGALAGLGENWLVSSQQAFGNATKLTLILTGAIEADFVVLPHWQMRIAFAALRFPSLTRLRPPLLQAGLRNLGIVACPGWHVIKGGPDWEKRYRRLGELPPWPSLTPELYSRHCSEFWAALVWITKKVSRGETRAAQREYHRVLLEKTWLFLEEEARTSGRPARPEARRAEQWLEPRRLAQTALGTSTDAAVLRRATLDVAEAFADVARSLAAARGWSWQEPAALRDWVRAQLQG